MNREYLNAKNSKNNGKPEFPRGAMEKSWLSLAIKRAFDIIISFVIIIFSIPAFLLIAIAIWRDSKGPILYFGHRVGKNGKLFKIAKFRTMYEKPESYHGAPITAHNDPRVTPVGRWLRDTKLNEFPQFWNVFKGDMSLVGPRPEDPSIAETWPEDIKKEVLSVKPGITSPATVLYHNEEAMLFTQNVVQQYVQEIGPDKLRLDQLYVHYRSFLMDLDVLLWTALIILHLVKDQTPPESLLFIGPVSRFFRRYMTWAAADMLVTISSIFLMAVIWRSYGPLNIGWVKALFMSLIYIFVFSSFGLFAGIYRINWSKATPEDVYKIFPPWLFSTTVTIFLSWVLKAYPATLLLTASIMALIGFLTIRYFKRLLRSFVYKILGQNDRYRFLREKVLIVGSGRTAEQVNTLFEHPSNISKFQVAGFIDDDMFAQGMSIYGKKVLGRIRDIKTAVDKYQINMLVLADHSLNLDTCKHIVESCESSSTRVVVIPDIFGSLFEYHNGVSQGKGLRFVEEQDAEFSCRYCVMKCVLDGDHLWQRTINLELPDDQAEVMRMEHK